MAKQQKRSHKTRPGRYVLIKARNEERVLYDCFERTPAGMEGLAVSYNVATTPAFFDANYEVRDA